MVENKKNSTIELLRFIMSILVISIHTHLFRDTFPTLFYLIPQGIARVAVPFFLVTTGYFFYERIQANSSYKSFLLKYFTLWIVFTIIELLIAGKFYYSQLNNTFLFVQRVVMVGLGDAYWYLWTVPVTMLMLIPFWKKEKVFFTLIVGLILFLLSMVNDSYSFLFDGTYIQKIVKLHEKIFIWTGAGFVSTILFLSIGACLNKYQYLLDDFIENKGTLIIISAVASTMLLLIEAEITCKMKCNDGMSKISLLFITPLLFIIALKYKSDNPFFNYLGSLSLYMYVFHPIVNDITKMQGWNSIVSFIFTTLVSIFISCVALKIQMVIALSKK